MPTISNYHICLNWDTNNESWRFWLRSENASVKQTDHQHLILACSKEEDEEFLTIVPNIVASLLRLEEGSGSSLQGKTAKLQRSDFERVFQNATLLQALEKHSNNPFRAFVQIEPRPSDPPVYSPWAQVALFKAFYLYLLRDERYRFIDADIALVYCAWQRYNLVKKLHRLLQPEEQVQRRRVDPIDSEFASAYRALAGLLAQEAFSYAFYVLWCYGGDEKAAKLSQSLVRERFELSLVLENQQSSKEGDSLPEKPHNAPLCFCEKANWRGAHMYPRFQEKRWRLTVQRLVQERLLPRYSVLAAARLAHCFSVGASFVGWLIGMRGMGWFSIGLPTVALVLTLGSFVYYYQQGSSLWNDCFTIAMPFLPLIFALIFLELRSLPSLILPRLWGGMIIGYLPLVLSDSPWQIVLSFVPSTGSPLWLFMLWTVLVGIAASYLFCEAYFAIGDSWRAFGRSLVVLVWALLVSLTVGILFCLLGAPIYYAERWEELGPLSPEFFAQTTYPVSLPALLTFAPIALFIGVVVQFIWEEKPVTATVWLPQEH